MAFRIVTALLLLLATSSVTFSQVISNDSLGDILAIKIVVLTNSAQTECELDASVLQAEAEIPIRQVARIAPDEGFDFPHALLAIEATSINAFRGICATSWSYRLTKDVYVLPQMPMRIRSAIQELEDQERVVRLHFDELKPGSELVYSHGGIITGSADSIARRLRDEISAQATIMSAEIARARN